MFLKLTSMLQAEAYLTIQHEVKMQAQELNRLEGVKFVWITNAKGWIPAKSNLKETFEAHKLFTILLILNQAHSID